MSTVAILIPAYNEAAQISRVIEVAHASQLGSVLVVDDGSVDNTAEIAEKAGATVHRLHKNSGKGAALAAGAQFLDVDILVLLDADLIGLKPEHIHDLATPLRNNEADMTRGIFTAGRWQTNFSQRAMPILNGQRALKRNALLAIPNLNESRYGVEIAISHYARKHGWRCCDIEMAGVSQIMKEEKRGWLQGIKQRLKMYREIITTWWNLHAPQ